MQRMTSLLLLTAFLVGCGNSDESQQTEGTSNPTHNANVAAQNAQPEQAASVSQNPSQKTVTYEQLLSGVDQLLAKKDIKNAVKILSAAIKAHPSRSEAYIKRAAIFAENSLTKQAIGDMNSAIAIDTENPKLRNTRGYFLLLEKEYELAEQDFNKAVDLDPEYPQAHNNRGLVFIGQGKHIQALNDFQTAIKLKPDYIDAMNNLGFVYMQMEDPDYEQAVATFSRVLEIDAEYLNALSNRGRAYFHLQRYDEAIADFNAAIAVQPNNTQYFLHRSEAYKASGQEALARQDVEHVVWLKRLNEVNRRIANNPRNAELWIARGRLMLEELNEQNLASAVKSFDNALALDSTHRTAVSERVHLHLRQGEFQAAVDLCTKTLESEESTEVRSLRGDALLQLGQLDAAIADFEACRRFDSRVVEAYRLRAEQHATAGSSELAQADRAHAERLERRLTEQTQEEATAPRKFVPVNYEQTATAEDGDTPAPQ